MRKGTKFFLISAMIFLLIVLQIKIIYDNSVIINSNKNKNINFQSESYMDPPKSPYSLKSLVENLQNATDPANRTDTDGDGIYDNVEKVIGTNFNNSDTDFDLLNDSYEIFNLTADPQDEDTNDDGLADYFEVEGIYSLDLDADGTSNIWDFDNDGDGVNDGVDISPLAKSTTHQEFDFTIKTDGKPMNINFQLIPQDKEHLKLYYQSWDWPYDNEGSMQDLDNSKDDVKIAPWLRITPNVLPNQSEVEDRGELVRSDKIEVPLFATFDQGNIVAFHGTFYYPERPAMDLTFNAELIWRVTGYTDLPAKAFNASNGKIVNVRSDNVLVANASESNQGIFQWIDLGDDKVALKVQNGQLLTVLDNEILANNATSIGTREEFTLINHGGNSISLQAYNGKYVTLGLNDILVASSTAINTFEEIDMGYIADELHLATYTEPFRLTGLGIEENYNCNLSIYYHENRNQTIAATMLLTYLFVRNSSTILNDMPTLFTDHGVIIENLSIFFYADNYEALTYMSNELISTALDNFPSSQIVPITTVAEESSKILDMKDLLGVSDYIMGDSAFIDFTSENLTIMKTLKTNFYNSSSYFALEFVEIMDEISSWGLEEDAIYTTQVMMVTWHTGIRMITYDGISLNFASPENSAITTVNAVALIGLNAAGIIASLVITFQAYKAMSNLLDVSIRFLVSIGASVKALKSVSCLGSLAGASAGGIKLTKALQFITKSHILDIIGVLIGIGLAIWAACEISKSIGGRLGQEVGAAYGIAGSLVAIVYGIVLAVLFSSVIGAIIAVAIIILDLIFGFSSKVTEWLAKVLFGSPHDYHHAEPETDMEGSLETKTYDWDDNGLDVGDRIEVLAHLIGRVVGKGESSTLEGWSYNVPWIHIDAPDGSSSTTSMNLERSLGSNAWDWPSQTNLLNRTQTGSGSTIRTDKYDSIAWIEPGISMVNFPVKLQIASRYNLMQKWYHRPAWYFGFKCWHTDWERGKTPAEDLTTFYYDVMPGNIESFLNWGSLTVNDQDGDGLNNTYEAAQGKSNIFRYDTDSDGLNDRYELEIGTDPQSADTDKDSLLDGHEAIYGGNATNGDTDGDGIYDFLEIAGWAISFNYSNQVFEMRVFSDPTKNDTDGDGVDDETEYWSGLNPRSSDTNGDGIDDVGSPQIEKCGIHESSVNIANDIINFIANATEIAVDKNQYSYLGIRNGSDNDYFILKLDPDQNYVHNWSLSFQPGKLAVDDINGFLYVENISENSFCRFYLNGTLVNHSQAAGTEPIVGIDVDSSGFLYVSRFNKGNSFAQIDKYFSNGTHLGSFGNYGSDPDEFDNLSAITVDNYHETIYALDGDRIVKINSSTGEYIATLPNGYQNMIDIATDPDGWVYVLDLFDPILGEGCVRKFDHNGMEDRNFVLTNTTNSPPWFIIHYPMRFAISQNVTNTSYHVLEQPFLSNPYPNILKFFQNVTLIPHMINGSLYDWDGDEFENLKEVVGWIISYKNNGTNYILNVNSSPFMMDTDFDGLSDNEELFYKTHPWNPDTDGDGLSDLYELEIGTNVTNDDTDGDGLDDSKELLIGSNPYDDSDTDDDLLSDLLEFHLGSNPSSNDTDSDGALDNQEYTGNSSLLDPDTDDDFMLDGLEYFYGCDPNDMDSDDDGLIDGDELVHGTNATLNDTDHDGALDGFEIDLWLDPLNNDTDGDGLLDYTELIWGSNPYLNDTDFDGVDDSADTDFSTNFTESVILAYDLDPLNQSSEFIDKFAEHTNETIVSYEDLIANHIDAPFIVLLGYPNPNNTSSVGGLIYELLKDMDDDLSAMMDNNTRHIAIRRGVYTNTQTIVMLPRALYVDVGKVISELRGMNVTITSDSCIIEFKTAPIIHNGTNYLYGVRAEGIDVLKSTNSFISIILGNWSLPTVKLSKYNNSNTPHLLNHFTGLNVIDRSLNQYIEINLTTNGAIIEQVPQATLIIFYRFSDLDRNGNGIAEDPYDINENQLKIYYYNVTIGSWIPLSLDLEWVLNISINTTDQELYGESYAGYIIIDVMHLSLFAVVGVQNYPYWSLFWSIYTALIILLLTLGMAVELVRNERSRQQIIKKKQVKTKTIVQKKHPIDKKEAIEEIGEMGEMYNIDWVVEDDKLILEVDKNKEFGLSKSGKTIIIANSRGGRRLKDYGLNLSMILYKYPKEKGKKVRPRKIKEMQNVEVELDGEIARFKIDITKDFGPSSTGKTTMVASSRGNGSIEGTDIIFGLNLYKSRKFKVEKISLAKRKISQRKKSLTLDDIPGLGENRIKLLKKAKIYTIEDLITCDPYEIAEKISGIGIDSIEKWIIKAEEMMKEE